MCKNVPFPYGIILFFLFRSNVNRFYTQENIKINSKNIVNRQVMVHLAQRKKCIKD